jgi:hypothetical protein
MGFSHVASGPFVRSSYHAGDTVDELLNRVKIVTHTQIHLEVV